mmetsp:Transcript_45990/g.143921  ORF Transcript_45990/g.143921 Transcript_45990/m.143921 type:complete len:203 (-) Transcript_45990:701-1309(-)
MCFQSFFMLAQCGVTVHCCPDSESNGHLDAWRSSSKRCCCCRNSALCCSFVCGAFCDLPRLDEACAFCAAAFCAAAFCAAACWACCCRACWLDEFMKGLMSFMLMSVFLLESLLEDSREALRWAPLLLAAICAACCCRLRSAMRRCCSAACWRLALCTAAASGRDCCCFTCCALTPQATASWCSRFLSVRSSIYSARLAAWR